MATRIDRPLPEHRPMSIGRIHPMASDLTELSCMEVVRQCVAMIFLALGEFFYKLAAFSVGERYENLLARACVTVPLRES